MSLTGKFEIISKIWKQVYGLVRTYPEILVPFAASGIFDLFMLFILYLAPQPHVLDALGPVIRYLWGDEFLHYPLNFVLLPKLHNHARNLSGFVVGVMLTGTAVSMIAQAYNRIKPDFWAGFQKSAGKYFRLALIWGMLLFCVFLSRRILKFVIPYFDSFRMLMLAEFLLYVFIQLVFIYTIPSIVLENRKIYASFLRSIRLIKNYPIESLFIVSIPGLLLIPLGYVEIKMPRIMQDVYPEMMLYLLFAKIAIVTAIDLFVTASATVMLLVHRDKDGNVLATQRV
jgi:hypothetical protein